MPRPGPQVRGGGPEPQRKASGQGKAGQGLAGPQRLNASFRGTLGAPPGVPSHNRTKLEVCEKAQQASAP